MRVKTKCVCIRRTHAESLAVLRSYVQKRPDAVFNGSSMSFLSNNGDTFKFAVIGKHEDAVKYRGIKHDYIEIDCLVVSR